MPWFKVDDRFHGHPKVLRAGNAAIGLWTRCAAYSAAYKTNGHIPRAIAREYGTRAEINALVRSGLWDRNGDGWDMHDYHDYNMPAAENDAQRALLAELKRKAGKTRAKLAHKDALGRFLPNDHDPW